MKKSMKNLMSLAIAIIFTLAFAQPTLAAEKVPGQPTELKYLGTANSKPVFLLNMNNAEADEFVITITDQYGYILYTERLEGKNVSRKFQLNTDEIDASDLKVDVTSKKNNNTVTYNVNRSTRLVQDVVVSKL